MQSSTALSLFVLCAVGSAILSRASQSACDEGHVRVSGGYKVLWVISEVGDHRKANDIHQHTVWIKKDRFQSELK